MNTAQSETSPLLQLSLLASFLSLTTSPFWHRCFPEDCPWMFREGPIAIEPFHKTLNSRLLVLRRISAWFCSSRFCSSRKCEGSRTGLKVLRLHFLCFALQAIWYLPLCKTSTPRAPPPAADPGGSVAGMKRKQSEANKTRTPAEEEGCAAEALFLLYLLRTRTAPDNLLCHASPHLIPK